MQSIGKLHLAGGLKLAVCAIHLMSGVLAVLLAGSSAFGLTQAQLEQQIYNEYPEYLTATTDWEKVQILREFSYKHTDWVGISSSPLYHTFPWSASAPERIEFHDNDLGGVFCGDTANNLVKIYEMFGFNAYYVGVRPGPSWSHAETLVRINDGGQDILTLHDPSLNMSYGSTNGSPMDYYDFLYELTQHQDENISFLGASGVYADYLVSPGEYAGKTPGQIAASTWPIDHTDFTNEYLPNGTLKIRSARTLWKLEQVCGPSYLPYLQSQGHPRETVYQNLYVDYIGGNSFGQSGTEIYNTARSVIDNAPEPNDPPPPPPHSYVAGHRTFIDFDDPDLRFANMQGVNNVLASKDIDVHLEWWCSTPGWFDGYMVTDGSPDDTRFLKQNGADGFNGYEPMCLPFRDAQTGSVMTFGDIQVTVFSSDGQDVQVMFKDQNLSVLEQHIVPSGSSVSYFSLDNDCWRVIVEGKGGLGTWFGIDDFYFATAYLPGDINGDGKVNSLDLAILGENWLEGTVPE